MALSPTDLVANTIAAYEAGHDLELYLHARDLGLSHDSLMQIPALLAIPLIHYVTARAAGATDAELQAAESNGCTPSRYALARSSGATHQETLHAHATGIPLTDYAKARQAGPAHATLVEAHSLGIPLAAYTLALSRGATHQELVSSTDPADYTTARAAAALPAQIEQALHAGIALADYASALTGLISHTDILIAHSELAALPHGLATYTRYRRAWSNHTDALALALQEPVPAEAT